MQCHYYCRQVFTVTSVCVGGMSDGIVERLPEWEPANMVMDKLQMSLAQRLTNEKREELAEVLQRVDKVIHTLCYLWLLLLLHTFLCGL